MTVEHPSPARIRIQRLVEWPDTDAAGHYHHSTLVRWVEAAEGALFDRLGVIDLVGTVPRVHYEADYHLRLWYRDVVDIELWIADFGRTSVRYEFEVRRAGQLAARGNMTAVYVESATGDPQEWPAKLRTLFLESGPQRPELIG